MADLASLSADQLAEKALRGYGFPVGGPTQEKAEAGVAELQTRANRAEAAEKERDETLAVVMDMVQKLTRAVARREAAEARLAEQKAAFVAEHETDHAEIRSLMARLAETQNALERITETAQRWAERGGRASDAVALIDRIASAALTTHPAERKT